MNPNISSLKFPWSLLQHMHLIAIVLDRRGSLLYCNEYLEQLTDWRLDEILDRNWFDIFVPDDSAEMRTVLADLLDGQRLTSHHDGPVLTKSGLRRHISWNNTVVRDPDGMVIGMASIGLDITDRRVLERAILELGAREQERVARELHEGLGQDLFGVALYASSMATGVDRGALPTAADLEHLATMTSTAIGTCRTMAHGLSPNSHMEGGLVEALRRMTALPRRERGREIRYVVIGQRPIELPLEELDHLYRIVKEAFTNALTHAKASEIVVRLEILPETLRVTVLDNGIGLPTRRCAIGGVGLKAMEYRADLLHARFRLGQLEPNGTQMVCETQHGKRRT